MTKKRNLIADRLAHWRSAVEAEKSKPSPNFSPSFSHFEAFCRVMAKYSPPLCEAADFFGLELENEVQKAALLTILAYVVFGKAPKGRPRLNSRKWDVVKLIQLAIDCNTIKEDAPGISDKKAVGEIKNRYRDRYKYATAEMMRQRLGSARRWLRNENRIRADKGMAPLTSQLTRPILTVE